MHNEKGPDQAAEEKSHTCLLRNKQGPDAGPSVKVY